MVSVVLPSWFFSNLLEVELEAKLEQATVKSGRISLRKIRQRCQQLTGGVRSDDAVDLKDAVDVEDIDELTERFHVESLANVHEARIAQVYVELMRRASGVAPNEERAV